MKFQAVIGAVESRSIEVEWLGGDRWCLDGKEKRIDSLVVEPGVYSLLVEGISYEVLVREEKRGLVVDIGGHLIPVRLLDPSKALGAATPEVEEGEVEVVSPMPGRIVRVMVGVGETVKTGQGLIVVEAMKMENELHAPKGGEVKSVSVKVGEAVEAGQVLAIIE